MRSRKAALATTSILLALVAAGIRGELQGIYRFVAFDTTVVVL